MEFGANYAQFYIYKLYILIYYIIQIILENYVYINYISDKSQSRVSTRLISSRWIRCKQISSLRGSICNINLFLSIDSYLPFFFSFDLRHLSRTLFQFQKLNLALNYHTFSRHKWREGRGEEEKYIYYYKIILENCACINTRFNRASVTNGKRKLTRVTIINNVKIIKIPLENYMYYYEILYVYCINYIRKLCTYKYRARFKQAESLESRNEIQNRGYGVEKSEAADYVM